MMEHNHDLIKEGSVYLSAVSSGKGKGPGTKGGVFYNPAMVMNRDISVLITEEILREYGQEVGKDLKILDGLCGTGVRALRLEKEVDWGGRDVEIFANDRDTAAFENTVRNIEINRSNVIPVKEDLPSLLHKRKFSLIDIDPFGSPLHFLDSALRSIVNGGVIALTATDTAALTGSIPRVAMRRYGARVQKTYFMHELSARVLMGSMARLAASRDMSAKPLYFYSSDHFVRGYLRMEKGARKADRNLDSVGFLSYNEPDRPTIMNWKFNKRDMVEEIHFGPLWVGGLSERNLVKGILERIETDELDNIASLKSIRKDLKRAYEEDMIPPGGFDVDIISSHAKVQQIKMDELVDRIKEKGFLASRSRFSDKVIKTDAHLDTITRIMENEGAK